MIPAIAHKTLTGLGLQLWFTLGPLLGPYARQLFCSSIGSLGWRFDRGGRRHLENNLRLLLPSANRRKIRHLSLCCYRNFIRHCLDITRLTQPIKSYKQVTIIDPSGQGAAALKKTCVAVTSHVNWETCLGLGHQTGLFPDSHAIAMRTADQRLSNRIAEQRAKAGCTTLWLDGPPLPALRALRRGTRLLLVGDRAYNSSTFKLDRAGATWHLPAGPAALAVQANAPIIPLILLIPGQQPPVLLIHPPLHPDPRLPAQARVQHLAQQHGRALLWLLAKGADQWVAFHALKADPTHPPRDLTP